MPFPLQDSYDYPEYSYDKYGGRLREALDWLFLQPGRGLCLMYALRGDISAILVHGRIFLRHILLREEEYRSLWLFLLRYQVAVSPVITIVLSGVINLYP